jgi:LDH2 family malate/lactate/ureidoglycolate dehydrogenase
VRAVGELGRRRVLGIPLEAAAGYVDEHGVPTTDPAEAIKGVIPAAGGAKGFGMAVMVDLLAGVLTGSPSGPDVPMGNADFGAFMLVLDPDVFGSAESVEFKLQRTADEVRRTGGRWPGDRARGARGANLSRGFVEVPSVVWGLLQESVKLVSPRLDLSSAIHES